MSSEAMSDETPAVTPTKAADGRTKRGPAQQSPAGSAPRHEHKGGRTKSPFKPVVEAVVEFVDSCGVRLRDLMSRAPESGAPTAPVGASSTAGTLPYRGEASSSTTSATPADCREGLPDALVETAEMVLGGNLPRQCQVDTWRHIGAQKDVVLVAATGDGKTLAALAPALASRLAAQRGQGTSRRVLVVSPLNRLITTQVDELEELLRKLGLDGTVVSSFIASDREFEEADAADEPEGPCEVSDDDLEALPVGSVERAILDSGRGKCDLVAAVVTPERLCSRRPDGEWTKTAAITQACCARTTFDLVLVDECHLILDWGDGFRSAFLNIGAACLAISELRAGLLASAAYAPQPADPTVAAGRVAEPPRAGGPTAVVAVTGTLRRSDYDTLTETLGMREPQLVVGDPERFHRANINLQVMFAEGEEERNMRELLSEKEEAEAEGQSTGTSNPSAIAVSACAALARLTRAQRLSLDTTDDACDTRGIVYVTEAGDVAEVAAALTCVFPHIGAVPYAGRGLNDRERDANYIAWECGRKLSGHPARLIVATCALGLGLNFAHEVELVQHVRVRLTTSQPSPFNPIKRSVSLPLPPPPRRCHPSCLIYCKRLAEPAGRAAGRTGYCTFLSPC